MLRHLFFFLILSLPVLAANTCYFPNGLPSTDEPCDPNALFTQCCGSRSACLTNGLCILEASNDTGINYARGTCTDKTWSSSLCPQQCQLNQDTPNNSSAYDFRTNGVQVWQCGSQGYGEEAKYCCESEAERQRCCSTQKAVFTLQGAVVGASTSATTTTTSSSTSVSTSSSRFSSTGPTSTAPSTSVTTPTSSPTTTSAVTEAPKTTSNGKAIGIGAGVGGAIGLIIIILIIAHFLRRHKRASSSVDPMGPLVSELHGTAKQPVEVWTQPAEVWTQPQELSSQRQPAWELSADPRTPRIA